jgi:ribulose-phosphate 3-epimerase
MISDPAEYARQFHDAGADHLTFHFEAVTDPVAVIDRIHELGCTVGVAINPPTPVSAIDRIIDRCESILVMSVMPGFGGQEFDPIALEKLRQLRDRSGGGGPLRAIDGGIHTSTIAQAASAGAELYAVGSAIFHPGSGYAQSFRELTDLAGERTLGRRGPLADKELAH